MIDRVLAKKLEPLIAAETLCRQRRVIALTFTLGAAVLAVVAAGCAAEWWTLSRWPAFGLVALVLVAGWAAWKLAGRIPVDLRTVARRVEDVHPDLQAALLTAVEQEPQNGERLGFLQERVVFEAVSHAVDHHDWRSTGRRRYLGAGWLYGFSMLLVAVSIGALIFATVPRTVEVIVENVPGIEEEPPVAEISVTPGDAEVERDTRLVVEARFEGKVLPAGADIVMTPLEEGAVETRIPMRGTVEESVFGGLITKVEKDAEYRVEFKGGQSETFKITTYEHPRMEEADATITPPEYAKQEPKEIKNVQKFSVLEGSKVDFRIKINKPVVAAELFGEDETVIPLTPSADDPTVLEGKMQPGDSQKYRVHLVDAADRANKRPPWLTVNVKKNLPPKIDLTFPKRDVAVSALQELPLEAKVWDDLGVTRSGATLVFDGKEKDVLLSEEELKGGKKHDLETLLSMEDYKAEPRQLVAYYFWAEDQGPSGETRRSMSDMFFAEVRHFEDIFREGQSAGGQGQGEGGESEKLLKLQKDVINATWKLVRDTAGGKTFDQAGSDVDVVKQSEEVAIGKVQESLERVEDAEIREFFQKAAESMEQAVGELEGVLNTKDTKELTTALATERAAYEWLIKAQSREHQVTRAQNSQGSGQQAQEKQLMQLELKQEDQRYEEQREATEEAMMDPQQQENLQVLNRLKELARRQEAIAEKIKELENLLEEAKTEAEKDELRRQLKRLQEEQEQLLRDLDDLMERMDEPDNRPNMAQEREELEQTRENVRETAEQLEQEQLADAANSATRAQRDLEQTRDEFRERTANQFEDDLRSMRDRARELASNQETLSGKMDERNETGDPFDRETGPLANLELGREMQEQMDLLDGLLKDMQRVSEEADVAEPLLSTKLYEAVRRAQTQRVEENLAEARDYVKFGAKDRAQEADAQASRGIDQLKEDVERAAEAVLGSETDALRMAQSELDDLIRQVEEKEMKNGQAGQEGQAGETKPMELADARDSKGQSPGQQGNQGEEEGEKGRQAGAGQQPGQQPEGQEGQEGQGQHPGKGQGQQEGKEPTQAGKGQQPGPGQGQEGQLGQQPGQGQEGQEPGQQGQEGQGQGQGQGQEGQQAGQGQGQGGEGQQPGQGQGTGEQPGQQPGQQPGKGQSGSLAGGMTAGGADNGGGGGSANYGGGDDRRRRLLGGVGRPAFFDQASEARPEDEAPLTGEEFAEWSDRLRSVEEILEMPDLKNNAARVLDNARSMRIDYRRNNLPPQVDDIQTRIIDPLVELRSRVSEELAKRNQENPLVPIDRDPVPPEYRDLVRRYYTELGTGR